MLQSAALTCRHTGALPDEAFGVRWHRKVLDVPRRKRAAERSTRRKGTERHVAVARERGRFLDGHCAAARGQPRGPDDSVGRAEGDRPWREVSRVTEERSEVVPRCGATHDGRRAEWLAGQVSSGHAAAAACDGEGIRVKGPCRNSLRDPDCLRGTAGSPSKTNRMTRPRHPGRHRSEWRGVAYSAWIAPHDSNSQEEGADQCPR